MKYHHTAFGQKYSYMVLVKTNLPRELFHPYPIKEEHCAIDVKSQRNATE